MVFSSFNSMHNASIEGKIASLLSSLTKSLDTSWTPSYGNITSYYKFDDTAGSTTAINTISSANNGTVTSNGTSGSFRYYKLEIISTQAADGFVQFADWKFFNNGTYVTCPSLAQESTKYQINFGANTVGQTVSYGFNNVNTDKFCLAKPGGGTAAVLSPAGYIVIDFTTATSINSYTWVTAGDSANTRDPITWNLYGSNDYNWATGGGSNGTWTTLHSVTNFAPPAARNTAVGTTWQFGGFVYGSAGIVNNAAYLTGGYATVPVAVLNNIASGTISCWVNLASISNSVICQKQRDGVNSYASLSVGSYSAVSTGTWTTGTAGIIYWHAQNGQSVIATSTSAIAANTWTHIAVTFTSTSASIYINGSLNKTTTLTNGSIPNDTTSITTIGGVYANNAINNSLYGYLDEFAVWNVALTAANIYTIYNRIYPGFSSGSIAGLQVWYDGADPLATGTAPANGTGVSSWKDKSGRGYHATTFGTAGNYTAANKSITFTGTTYYTTTYPANPTAESVFVVFRQSSNATSAAIVSSGVGGRGVAVYTPSTGFGVLNCGVTWGATIANALPVQGTTYLGEGFFSGTSTYASVNGNLTITGPTTVTAFTNGINTQLGFQNTTASPNGQFFGDIMEILIYNSNMQALAANRQAVEGYLSWKWGIQASLPAAHPYKNDAPIFGSAGTVTVSATGTYTKSITGFYTLYAFTSGTGTISFDGTVNCNVLIVGGGGGGGYGLQTHEGPGGGGAGGVGYGTLTLASSTTYTISIGTGGNGAISTSATATSGSNTTFSGVSVSETAYGGGFGGSSINGSGQGGAGGGSGGGGSAAWGNQGFGATTKGSGTLTYLGNNGAQGTGGGAGGGGGGATGAGLQSTSNTAAGGNGGAGYTWTNGGGSVIVGGGGGGGGGGSSYSNTNGGSGGSGGGGAGGSNGSRVGVAGTPNTGGGGGGGHGNAANGGAGGSGVVYIEIFT